MTCFSSAQAQVRAHIARADRPQACTMRGRTSARLGLARGVSSTGLTLSTPPSGECALAVGGAGITPPVVAVVPPFDDGVALEGDNTHYPHPRQAPPLRQRQALPAFYHDTSVAPGDISDRHP